MIDLTIVTLTRSLETKTLQRCKDSDQQAIVPGVKHEITVCENSDHFLDVRNEAYRSFRYIANV